MILDIVRSGGTTSTDECGVPVPPDRQVGRMVRATSGQSVHPLHDHISPVRVTISSTHIE